MATIVTPRCSATEDGDDCHYAVPSYEDDDDDCGSSAGYEGQSYAPSYYGGPAVRGHAARLLAARAQVSARIARARARGDWRVMNDGYREVRVIDGELARLGARRNYGAYYARPAFGSPTADGLLGGLAGAPVYNSYGYNSGYNGAYNTPSYNNGSSGTMSTLVPFLQQFVH